MIKQIIKSLKENLLVTDWSVNEVETQSFQTFYVLQKLETTRVAKTTEYTVTVYHKFNENGIDYMGSSSFEISHKLSKKELSRKIEDAVFAAKFIKNKYYSLVKGEKKKSWKENDFELEPFTLLDKIANIFINESTSNIKFNSLELFVTKVTEHFVNSQAVDLKKTINKVNVEAIPSYDEEQNVELYKYYTYHNLDFDVIKNDAVEALKDVTARYNAKSIKDIEKVDVLLKDEEVYNFFDDLISYFSYTSVYKQNTDKKIGDAIQKTPIKDLLTISYIPSSKADAFDPDGVLLKPTTIVEKGILVNYFGNNQYAQYLDMVPTGVFKTIKAEKGKVSIDKLSKKPHLEIIALSGIQIDMYSGYIGGEVRLANYFDGSKFIPVSGFSFSGNIDACLNNLVLSKETIKMDKYQGPKYIKLTDMGIL